MGINFPFFFKFCGSFRKHQTCQTKNERIYNSIMAMGFPAMFTFRLDNTKTMSAPDPAIDVMGAVDTFGVCFHIKKWSPFAITYTKNQTKPGKFDHCALNQKCMHLGLEIISHLESYGLSLHMM